MAQLIPLLLKSTSDITSKRLSSCPPSDPPSFAQPPIPPKSSRRRPGPVTELTIIPYTPTEWKKVMAEVKELYDKRQYKQCSARSKQILESIKDPYKVHPIYQIYLSFFAASSLELTARSLHNNTSTKLPLLQESLSFYQAAESHMEFAAFATDPTIMSISSQHPHNSNASISSSIRSSVSSIFSQASAASSILDSPSSSDADSRPSSIIHRPQPLRQKKKVSFSTLLPATISESDGESDSDLLDRFPSPPSHDLASPTIIPPNYHSQTLASRRTSNSPTRPSSEREKSTQAQALSLTRYRHHLTTLSTQLTYHITSVQSQIRLLTTIRRARRSNLPDLFTFSSHGYGYAGMGDEEREEMRKTDIQERIRRGRENGWARKRWDGERYRVLRERALGEIEGGMF